MRVGSAHDYDGISNDGGQGVGVIPRQTMVDRTRRAQPASTLPETARAHSRRLAGMSGLVASLGV